MGVVSNFLKYNPISILWTMASTDTTVEPDETENLKNALKEMGTKSDKEKRAAAELLLTNEKNNEWGDRVGVRQEKDIVPDVTDKNDFRNDSVMEKVNSTNVTTKPANELENSPREKGGREREAREKK